MEKYQVLVVDDSAVYRKKLTSVIEACPSFSVSGIARNGADALEKVERLQPDLIIMDVEMPLMDGVTALKLLMRDDPHPVIMAGSEEAQERICRQYGAVHFVYKTEVIDEEREQDIYVLHQAMLRAIHEKPPAAEIVLPYMETVQSTPQPPAPSSKARADLLLIGCSTGGPSALKTILPRLPGDLSVPVIVIQHMPPGFTKPLAERLNNSCALRVKEAEQGDRLERGTIYIAPAGYQTIVKQQGGARILQIMPSGEEHLYKPSVDVALQSAAAIYKERLVTAILTGMGTDGTKGCKDVKAHNGYVIAEAQTSCVVFGMPKSVIQAGYADEVADLQQIHSSILNYLQV